MKKVYLQRIMRNEDYKSNNPDAKQFLCRNGMRITSTNTKATVGGFCIINRKGSRILKNIPKNLRHR